MSSVGRVAVWAAVVASCFMVVPAGAEMPRTITYQGLVTDPATSQPTVGSVDITFRLYHLADCAAETPTALWSELHNAVSLTDGAYTVQLGSIELFDNAGLAFDQPYCLGIVIGGTEVLPRRQLAGAPFAQRAGVVEGVVDGALTGASFKPGSIDGTKFADGSIDPAKLMQMCADGESPVLTTGGWECRKVRLVTVGDLQACYTGPPGTMNFGVCKPGVWRWEGGAFGPCTGQVTPIAEVCSDGLDNDCNGGTDDGC